MAENDDFLAPKPQNPKTPTGKFKIETDLKLI